MLNLFHRLVGEAMGKLHAATNEIVRLRIENAELKRRVAELSPDEGFHARRARNLSCRLERIGERALTGALNPGAALMDITQIAHGTEIEPCHER